MSNRRDTSLGTLRDVYLAQLPLNTGKAYGRALAQFFAFLDKPAARHLALGPAPTPVEARRVTTLTTHDVSLLVDFIDWLAAQTPAKGRSYRLSPATIRQRGTALINWFNFMDLRALLPAEFPIARALSTARITLKRFKTDSEKIHKAIEPPANMVALIHYYDKLDIPPKTAEKRANRIRLEGFRNRALLYTLADSGGRISEVLQLRVEQFSGSPPRGVGRPAPAWDAVIRCEVAIKGGGRADLVFTDFSVPAIKAYLGKREHIVTEQMFVSHAPQSSGIPLSRSSAWRIVNRAARRLAMGNVHPHDFRHWRATQMRRLGVPIEVVQDFLNHRSIEITRRFYAAVSPEEVNEAARKTRPR